MPEVALDAAAPDFSLEDFRGDIVRLSAFRGAKRVLLVLNRGFI